MQFCLDSALFRVDGCTGAVLETDLTVALVQPQSGAERRRALAVDFDYVSRQRKRICDDIKMLLSLIAVSVDDACFQPLCFTFVALSLSLSLSLYIHVCVYMYIFLLYLLLINLLFFIYFLFYVLI